MRESKSHTNSQCGIFNDSHVGCGCLIHGAKNVQFGYDFHVSKCERMGHFDPWATLDIPGNMEETC